MHTSLLIEHGMNGHRLGHLDSCISEGEGWRLGEPQALPLGVPAIATHLREEFSQVPATGKSHFPLQIESRSQHLKVLVDSKWNS